MPAVFSPVFFAAEPAKTAAVARGAADHRLAQFRNVSVRPVGARPCSCAGADAGRTRAYRPRRSPIRVAS